MTLLTILVIWIKNLNTAPIVRAQTNRTLDMIRTASKSALNQWQEKRIVYLSTDYPGTTVIGWQGDGITDLYSVYIGDVEFA